MRGKTEEGQRDKSSASGAPFLDSGLQSPPQDQEGKAPRKAPSEKPLPLPKIWP